MQDERKVIVYSGEWTRETCKSMPKSLFIFGDNDAQKGCKGQAVIRYEPNAYGIPTKKMPYLSENSFYTDGEYAENKIKIDAAIEKIISVLHQYDAIIVSAGKLGSGLAQLDKRAPKTYKYLQEQIDRLLGDFVE